MSRIVLVSYGLRRHTRDALRRIGRAADHVHLVAASPTATRGLRTHRSRFVTVEEDVGRDGLRSALESAGDATVLLLHEDVLLDPAAATRLLEVARREHAVVVPSTNHRDVDNAVGALPPDVVQPLGEPQPVRWVKRFRTACIAAPAGRLLDLLPHRLTAAATQLHLEATPAAWVQEATATHLDLGRDVREDPTGPDGRPLLVASMIVRDEESFLPGCLASLEGVVDRIDVCDTGSSDRTIAIAREAGAQVIQRPWRDDFAWARNEVLALSHDAAWVLQIDADERLVVDDADDLRSFLATALFDADAFDVPLHNVDEAGNEVSSLTLPRLFRPQDMTYRGSVHEVPARSDGRSTNWSLCSELRLDHLGYQQEVVAERDKARRNLRIARADHDEDPTPVTAYQLARSLVAAGRDDEALPLLVELYDELEGDHALAERTSITIHGMYATRLAARDQLEQAYEVVRRGLTRHPGTMVLRSVHADLAVRLGRFDEVVEEASVESDRHAPLYAAPTADATHLLELAKSQLATEDVAGAASTVRALLDAPMVEELDRWVEIVSVVAIATGEDAIEVLLDAATADRTGGCLAAVSSVMEPADAAAFASVVLERAEDPSDEQVGAAVELWVAAGALDRMEQLPGGLRAGMAAWVAADDVVDRARLVTAELPPAAAAPILGEAVERGASDPELVRTALAVASVAGDPATVTQLAPAARSVAPDVVERLVERTAERGDEATAGRLAGLLTMTGTDPRDGARRTTSIVRVLGMHRSRTSAVARALRALGVGAGPEEELIPPAPDNPTGFHEHRPLVVGADALLARLGGRWDAPPPVPAGDATPVVRAWTRGALFPLDRLTRIVDGPLLWKDPRICLLLPLLDEVLAGVVGDDVAVTDVHVVRSPAEVTASLVRRDRLHPEHAARLWVRYVTDQLTAAPDAPLLLADDLVADPQGSVERLSIMAGLAPDDDALMRAAAVVEPGQGGPGQDQHAPAPDGWAAVARTMYDQVRGGDVAAAAAAGRDALAAADAELAAASGGLALLRAGTSAAELGRAVRPGLVRLTDTDARAVAEARSLGWRPVTGSAEVAAPGHETHAVWAADPDDLRAAAVGLLASDPRIPLAAPGPTPVADATVAVADAAGWLADPPAVASRPPRVAVVEPVDATPGLTSVVVPVHGGWSLTDRCLAALRANTAEPLEVIVVDDSSPDDSRARAAADARVDTVVALDRNHGFPGAVNAGLAATTGQYVCILNNDTEVQAGWLTAMLRELAAGAVLVGPRTNRITGPQAILPSPAIDTDPDQRTAWVEQRRATAPAISWPLDRLVGFCLVAERSLLETIGGFDEGVGRGNYEDDELCVRASAHGSLRVVEDSLVLHAASATFGTGDRYVRAMLEGARHVHGRLDGGVLSTHGIVLAEGAEPGLRATVESLLRLGLVVTVVVLEGVDDAAHGGAVGDVRQALAGIPLPVDVVTAAPGSRRRLDELTGRRARGRLVLFAGETVLGEDTGVARRGLEDTVPGSVAGLPGVRVVAGDAEVDVERLRAGTAPPVTGLLGRARESAGD